MAKYQKNRGSGPKQEMTKPKINKALLQKASQLFSYLKPYRTKFLVGMVFLFFSSLTMLAFPALLGAMIDAAQGIQKYTWLAPSVQKIGIISFVFLIFQTLTSFFRVRIFVEVAEKSLANIRKDTYEKLIVLPIDFFVDRRVGELNSRLSADLSQIQDTLTTTLAGVIRQSLSLILGIALLVWVSPKLALMNLSILPVIILMALLFGRFIRKLSKQAQDELADSNNIVQETLLGISNVKAFVNEYHEVRRYQNKLDAVVHIAMRGASYRAWFVSFIMFCIFGAIIAVIWYGATLVMAGEISVGDLTTYILYSMFVAGSMGSFPELYANIQRALGASERVLDILQEEPEAIDVSEKNREIENKITGRLTFDKVAFSYPSRRDHKALEEVSFDVKSGQKIALVGPSGAGKTTISSLILQFYQPLLGTIYYDGVPAAQYSLTDLRNQVAIVPQDVLLFGGTIRENIGYGDLKADAKEIIIAAERANAHDFIMEFPDGYDTVVGDRGVKLSGGQRQRIAIARALLKNPAILILDEATSALDSESERLVQQALEELMKDRTSIVIAHRLSTIMDADSILIVERGRIIDKGTHRELLNKGTGLYHYLHSLQSNE